MKHSELVALGTKLVKAREPMLLVGAPGLGKTDAAFQIAANVGADLIVSHPVVDDPTDYKGMPAVIKNGDLTEAHFLPFGNLTKLINAQGPTIAFMDDIGQAPPAVQAALMQLILSRHVNGHKVSDEVVFIAATNRRQDKAAVTGMIAPLLDRFTTVVELQFNTDDWADWAIRQGIDPVLVSFVRFRPDIIGAGGDTKDMKKSPTPRSVAGLGRLLALDVPEASRLETYAGAVGEGFATEFLAFQRIWESLPDREDIYQDPAGTKMPSDKKDVLYALAGMLAFHATKKNLPATLQYMSRCEPEFTVLFLKDALSRDKTLQQSKCFIDWVQKNKQLFGYVS